MAWLAYLEVAVMQITTVFRQLSLVWTEPVLALLELLGFMAFNMDVLRVACTGIASSGLVQ